MHRFLHPVFSDYCRVTVSSPDKGTSWVSDSNPIHTYPSPATPHTHLSTLVYLCYSMPANPTPPWPTYPCSLDLKLIRTITMDQFWPFNSDLSSQHSCLHRSLPEHLPYCIIIMQFYLTHPQSLRQTLKSSLFLCARLVRCQTHGTALVSVVEDSVSSLFALKSQQLCS